MDLYFPIEPPLAFRSVWGQEEGLWKPLEKTNVAIAIRMKFGSAPVRMVLDHSHEYTSRSAAIAAITPKIGCGADTLRKRVKPHEIDIGLEAGVTSADRERMRELERENRQPKQANEILRKASAFFTLARPAKQASSHL